MTIPLHKWIQTYPNFPKPGILFYDIAPILENPAFLKQTVETLAAHIDEWSPDLLVGIDSRGFLFATPVALARGLGVVMIRKKGKLPGARSQLCAGIRRGHLGSAVRSCAHGQTCGLD